MAESRVVAAQGVGLDTRSLALGGFGTRYDTFDPIDRRVAVQGTGYGTRLLALQGFGIRLRRQVPRGAMRTPRRRHRDRDDDVLLFLIR